jgi:TolB-like protein/DNA-binding winged helix-turn-helix (wHTH) protein/tetratricopeptide (TPR) repeat protein
VGSSPAGAQESIRFGKDFEVDLRAFELRHLGRVLKLERIPLQVLVILIEQKGQLVSREEIAEKIWGKNVFLDTDNSINSAIRKIRQTLKDDPQQPRYVETLPGRGYRFIAPVSDGMPHLPQAGSAPAPHTEPAPLRPHLVSEQNYNKMDGPTAAVAGLPWQQFRFWIALFSCCAIGLVAWIGWHHFYGATTGSPIRSIAVLPLQNLSGDPAQDFFADGMTEQLITELSRIQSLRVVSHTSVMEYKGTKKHLPQIARELGVDGVLEGSVIRENDQVRVTVQLLDGPHDRHIWSESYERPLHGILSLQREVAEAVTRQIRIELTPEQQARVGSAHSVNPEAYDAYLRGRFILNNQFTMGPPLLQAKSYFEESIRKDQGFAEAYSGLADAYLYLALFRQLPQEAAFQSAHEALSKAKQLDDSIGEMHDTLGVISWRYDWNLDAAEREFNRAIALAPSYTCAHEDRAEFLALLGRRAEAVAELARINQIDLGPSAAMTEAGVYYQLRDYPALVEAAQRGIASNPNEWLEHYNLGIGYAGTGNLTKAITEFQKSVELSNGDSDANASLAHAYAVTGRRTEAEQILRDLQNRPKDKEASPYILATIYAGLGEKDKAMEFLERAYNEKSLEISWHLKADPRIDNLRADPRFQSLSRRMGFTA